METRSSSSSTPQRWLLRRPKEGAKARIFCLPYSGVGASMYARWPRTIGGAEVCMIQLPGRENRAKDPHYGTYESLAESLVQALEPYLDVPFAFFGHCSSALAAFETARQLHAAGLPTPDRLFISSQVAPHDGPYGRFLGMTDDELAEELADLTRAMGSEPDPDLIRFGLGVMRADVDANKQYRLEAPEVVPSAITVLGWMDDVEVAPDLMKGWREYSDDVRFTVLQGSHHSFLQAPLALRAELEQDIKTALEGR
ncbi:thioesterase domain-containing protein [Streptomyces sp. APSN-46.1]|uniref:thioesterase II family protein n=1 Tax=Streptomyces sp. APSN-46.1 TaxID=2929049 RepID=UPI001FB535EC|nr:thioesterase domain-containing protein [Streptomyces sp. APSN-46.1]MCJ1681149.1 thioesterase domain-containing protein [Streptomyces sp. APSN-46.1]